MDWRKVVGLFVETFFGWTERKAPVFAAAIAYSTLFSLAPLLIISINLASLTINAATFETRLLQTIEEQVGPEVAQLTEEILAARFTFQPSGTAALISVGLLLFGASGVFLQLRGALNAMWHIQARPASVPETLFGVAKGYLISVVAALLLGLVPIVLLFASAVVASLPARTVETVYRNESLTTVIQLLASPVAYFVLFALVLKYLPQADAPWRVIWPGALLSAIGYWIGSVVLGYYVQNTAIRSIYGAAGSALALLIWAYYSAYIFLYGAKFVYSVANAYGYPIVPDKETTFVHLRYDGEE
ncbi:MAG: YihY/virulence factor BrkB family protein [Caldilineaceae bacterium]|nr:YihY/virulence factor BrkB family protein [Caldilineaceae bacterium]